VPDLQLEVPEHVEHGLDHALAPGGLLVGQQEEEIDVGAGGEGAAAVAARRHDGEPLAGGGVLHRVELTHDGIVDGADYLIHEIRQAAGAGEAVAVLDQPPIRIRTAAIEDAAQLVDEPGAHGRWIAARDRQGAL
jgi:hypothetical protein